jgi:Dimerisation domain of Zinc Transporter
MRWIGHRLHAEANLVVDDHLSLLQAHEFAADAEHQLVHAIPRLSGATLHTDPARHADDHHTSTCPPAASQPSPPALPSDAGPASALINLLKWLDPVAKPRIVMAPLAVISLI